MCTNISDWSICLLDKSWLSCDEGVVYVGDGAGTGLTSDEEAKFEHAHQTTIRWGVPIADDKRGDCRACKWMERIDGDADFLDYGVCTSIGSAFDGRVVNMTSGYNNFLEE